MSGNLRKVGTIFARIGRIITKQWGTQLPNKISAAGRVIVRRPIRPPQPKGFFSKLLWRTAAARGTAARASAMSRRLWTEGHRRPGRTDENLRYGGLLYQSRRYNEEIVERIRDLFGNNFRYNPAARQDVSPSSISGYEIGSFIAKGSNAAVYEACLAKPFKKRSQGLYDLLDEPGPRPQDRHSIYPLAIKLMFNYAYEFPENYLWKDMGAELVPIINNQDLFKRLIGHSFRPLPKAHPNVVKIQTAFIDSMVVLPGAEELYPEALPNADWREHGLSEPKTLYLVMKRYRMTLHEYMLNCKRNYWNSRVMFGQLLEALVYLYEHNVSHRDLKSDNILVDFNSFDEAPHLVVSDFGCCLALPNRSFRLDYPHQDVDLGGNLAMRPPEIRCTSPGPGVKLDFSKADLWAAGTLGYEMFTRENPFYVKMKSNDYREADLPQLPAKAPAVIKMLIHKILRIDPKERPDPRTAANVVALSLFRFGENVADFVASCGIGLHSVLRKDLWSRLNCLTSLYAAETMLAHRLESGIVSSAELQLRATFLSRFDNTHVWEALSEYFLLPSVLQSTQNSNHFTTPVQQVANGHAGSSVPGHE